MKLIVHWLNDDDDEEEEEEEEEDEWGACSSEMVSYQSRWPLLLNSIFIGWSINVVFIM